jgi:hypothetical protein
MPQEIVPLVHLLETGGPLAVAVYLVAQFVVRPFIDTFNRQSEMMIRSTDRLATSVEMLEDSIRQTNGLAPRPRPARPTPAQG